MNGKYIRLHILNTTIHRDPNIFVRTYRKIINWFKTI